MLRLLGRAEEGYTRLRLKAIFYAVALTLEEFRRSALFKPVLWEGKLLYGKPGLKELFGLKMWLNFSGPYRGFFKLFSRSLS